MGLKKGVQVLPLQSLSCLPSLPYPFTWDRLPSSSSSFPSSSVNVYLTPTGDQATEMSEALSLSQAPGVLAPRSAQKGKGYQYSAETHHVSLTS